MNKRQRSVSLDRSRCVGQMQSALEHCTNKQHIQQVFAERESMQQSKSQIIRYIAQSKKQCFGKYPKKSSGAAKALLRVQSIKEMYQKRNKQTRGGGRIPYHEMPSFVDQVVLLKRRGLSFVQISANFRHYCLDHNSRFINQQIKQGQSKVCSKCGHRSKQRQRYWQCQECNSCHFCEICGPCRHFNNEPQIISPRLIEIIWGKFTRNEIPTNVYCDSSPIEYYNTRNELKRLTAAKVIGKCCECQWPVHNMLDEALKCTECNAWTHNRCHPFAKVALRGIEEEVNKLQIDYCFGCSQTIEVNGVIYGRNPERTSNQITDIYKLIDREKSQWAKAYDLKSDYKHGQEATLETETTHYFTNSNDKGNEEKAKKRTDYVYARNKAHFGISQVENGIGAKLRKEIRKAIEEMRKLKGVFRELIFDPTSIDIVYDHHGQVKRTKYYFCGGYTYGSATKQGFNRSKLHMFILNWLPKVYELLKYYFGDDLSGHDSSQINFYYGTNEAPQLTKKHYQRLQKMKGKKDEWKGRIKKKDRKPRTGGRGIANHNDNPTKNKILLTDQLHFVEPIYMINLGSESNLRMGTFRYAEPHDLGLNVQLKDGTITKMSSFAMWNYLHCVQTGDIDGDRICIIIRKVANRVKSKLDCKAKCGEFLADMN